MESGGEKGGKKKEKEEKNEEEGGGGEERLGRRPMKQRVVLLSELDSISRRVPRLGRLGVGSWAEF